MLINSNLSTVKIFNGLEEDIKVPRNYLLRNVVDFDKEGAFSVSPEIAPLSLRPDRFRLNAAALSNGFNSSINRIETAHEFEYEFEIVLRNGL